MSYNTERLIKGTLKMASMPATVVVGVPEEAVGKMGYRVRAGLHVTLWVVAIAFQCLTGFNVSNHLDGCVVRTNSSSVLIHTGPSTTTTNVGITGAAFTVLGVAIVLAVAATVRLKPSYIYQKSSSVEHSLMPSILFAMQFFTAFGTVSAFYIFSQAAQDPDNCDGYGTSVAGVLVLLFAQLLLYSNIASVQKQHIPRNLLPAAVLSVQLISYFAIASGDFAPLATDSQKMASLFSPICTASAVLIVLAVEAMSTMARERPSSAKESSGLLASMPDLGGVGLNDNYPVVRAFVMFVFALTSMLSVYKVSFIAVSPDSTSYAFALADSVLTFVTLSVMFVNQQTGISSGEMDN